MAVYRRRFIRIITMAFWAIVAAALFAESVQGDTLQRADFERYLSLEKKMARVMQDLTDAAEPVYQMQDYRSVNCLTFLHTQATYVGNMWATVGILIGLAGVMKDTDDEIVVLDQLRRSLTLFSGQLASSRKFINPGNGRVFFFIPDRECERPGCAQCDF